MPWERLEDVPPQVRKHKGVPLTLEQANWVARIADALEGQGRVQSPWAVAWAQFERRYKIHGNRWVLREDAQQAESRLLAEISQPRIVDNMIVGVEILRPGVYKGRPYPREYLARLAENMQFVEAERGFQPPYRLGHPTDEAEDEVWADPTRVRGHWTNFRLADDRLIADLVVENPAELDAIRRRERRYVSADLLHDYQLDGQDIGPFIKAVDAVDVPAVLTASLLALHDNGDEFRIDPGPDRDPAAPAEIGSATGGALAAAKEQPTTEGGRKMSGVIEGLARFLRLAPDAPPDEVEKVLSERLGVDAGSDAGTEPPPEEQDDGNEEASREHYRRLEEELAAERKAREELAAQLAAEQQARRDEQARQRVEETIRGLCDDGYLTPAQGDALRPVLALLADESAMLGEGGQKQHALQAFSDAIRAGGQIVRLGLETTTEQIGDDERETIERMARLAGVTEGGE